MSVEGAPEALGGSGAPLVGEVREARPRGAPGAWVERVQRAALSGDMDEVMNELAGLDGIGVRSVRRKIVQQADRLLQVVMDTLNPPEMRDEQGNVMPAVQMAPRDRAATALKLLALGLEGPPEGAGEVGARKVSGLRGFMTAQGTAEELAEMLEEHRKRKEAGE